MERAYVYVIECAETGLHKIGTTRDCFRRIGELQATSAFPLAIVVTMCCHPSLGTFFEKTLHQRFKSKRTHGEWFKLSPEDIQWFTSRHIVLACNLDLVMYDEHLEFALRETVAGLSADQIQALAADGERRSDNRDCEREL